VSGGRVEWFKDGVLVPKVGGKQAVERPCHNLLEPNQIKDRTSCFNQTVGCGKVNGKQAESVGQFPPNNDKSYLSGSVKGGLYCDLSDAGIYQAKVVSSVGERYSSAMHVEVQPDYGKDAKPMQIAKQQCVRCDWGLGPEAWGLGPGAWGLGTGYFNSAGCWEKKLPYEGMSREVEAEGFDALDAAMGNFLFKNCALRYPHIIEEEGGVVGVSENVRQAIARIRIEKDMDLGEKLDANLDSVLQHLDEEDDWPYRRNLVKSKENLLVDSSLNHTWQTHLQWEQAQADEWRKNFHEDPAEMLRWTGFRSKKVQSGRKLRLAVSDSSSSDSMSSSDSEEEHSYSGAAPPAPMSVRFDEEEEVVSGLDKLLSHHEEDQVPK
jgi:hypothetical protein